MARLQSSLAMSAAFCSMATIVRLLPEILLRLRRSHPRVQIAIRDMASPAQIAALQREELDLGFVRMPIADASLETIPVLREQLVAAVGVRSAWRERHGLRSLAGEPFVLCSRTVSASYYDQVGTLCRAAGFARPPPLDGLRLRMVCI